MLRKVSFQYVKIDREVLVSAESGNGRAALMAILAFAAESHAQVVIEGVEDRATLDFVRDLSRTPVNPANGLIHGVQGYLLGRPQPEFLAPGDIPSPLAA